jgi:hypothetical protein
MRCHLDDGVLADTAGPADDEDHRLRRRRQRLGAERGAQRRLQPPEQLVLQCRATAGHKALRRSKGQNCQEAKHVTQIPYQRRDEEAAAAAAVDGASAATRRRRKT